MAALNDSGEPVLLFEHATRSGHVLAEARLNAESTLNALSLPMIEILSPALARWAPDDRVVAVLLTGAGDRAFSAGGDIQALYRAMVKNHEAGEVVDPYPFRFFEEEYRLDYQIHTFPRPVVALGHGIVMGGGLGIFSGASHRVVTEKTRIALPEVTIGLYPDAGATWLLRNMPRHLATFVALTGAQMNAGDAMAAGIGTHSMAAAEREALREALLGAEWQGRADADEATLRRCLDTLPAAALPEPQSAVLPEDLSPQGSPQEVAERLRALRGRSDWVDAAIDAMEGGCPATVGIVVEQLQRAPELSLAETFRLEMVVSTHCATHPDFAEGVRALLIDKDRKPRWRYASIEALPDDYVAEHFEPPWPENPLNDLEETRT